MGSSYVLATDQHARLAEGNIWSNRRLLDRHAGRIEAATCDWAEVQRSGALPAALSPPEDFDLVLGSDVFYEDVGNAHAFLAALCALCRTSGTEAIVCQSFPGPHMAHSHTMHLPLGAIC